MGRGPRAPLWALAAVCLLGLVVPAVDRGSAAPSTPPAPSPSLLVPADARGQLERLVVKGRAPRVDYRRAAFGPAWSDVDGNGCRTRDDVLRRDLTAVGLRDRCVVVSGTLVDPYTHRTIAFAKARADEVQIDHVVSLSDAWQKGAQSWDPDRRLRFANDPLNLLAVSAQANQAKSDSDTASWLPPYKPFRCAFVTRQVLVKARYGVWVTAAEKAAMRRVLSSC